MTPNERLQKLFLNAIDRPVSSRADYLEEVAGHDPELHAELLSLLEFHDSESESASSAVSESISHQLQELEHQAGDLIGPYEVVEKLGEGGFAVVYLGRQREPVSRRIALKLIKPGMDTQSVLARFSAEQQALALMNHQGISRVIDQGLTTDGRPWFAMEYVKGDPIDVFCDEERLSLRDRIKLFIEVCRAVHHAHLRGVIHRDLKPNNILVSRDSQTGELIPKVIDFGIAKALDAELSDQTVITRMGQLIGTPEFMSPEQAVMSPTDIDTRSDVYALGILLYKLLCGFLPRSSESFRGIGFADVQRLIAEDDPPRPSSPYGSASASEQSQIAHDRATTPGVLASQLAGELSWIPLKAMSSEKSDRYGSAESLADDLEAYLGGQALLAGPQSLVYRMRKVVSRHRTVAILTSCIIVLMVLTTFATTTLWIREQRARSESQRSLETANASVNALRRIAGDMEPEFVLNRLVDNFAPDFMDPIIVSGSEPDVDRIRQARISAEKFLVSFIYDPIIDEVVELIERDETESAKVLAQKYGQIAWQAGVHVPALELTRLRLEAHRKSGTLTPSVIASTNNFMAIIYTFQGELEQALELHLATIKAIKSEPMDTEMTVRLWYSLNNTAHVQSRLGRFDEAIETARRSKDVAREVERSDLVSWGSYTLSQLLDNSGRYDEAYLEAMSNNQGWLETVRKHPERDHGEDVLSFVRGVANSAGKSGRLELSLELWTILCEARKHLHRPAAMEDLAPACEQRAMIEAAIERRDRIPVVNRGESPTTGE